MEIEAKDKFPDDSRGWARRWALEFEHAEKFLEEWRQEAAKAVKKFLGGETNSRKLNLWHSDVKTKFASLYGNIPQVQVGRRYGDANDDAARVGGEMLGRMLNCDIESDSDTFKEILASNLWDYLTAGFCAAHVRYEVETEVVTDPMTGEPLLDESGAQVEQKKPGSEHTDTDYIHWRDACWPRVRTKTELPWFAVKHKMDREALVKRFGEEIGSKVPLNASKKADDERGRGETPWDRAEVWEIWNKASKEVFFWVKGFNEILDRKPDPLGLDGFFPFRFLFANPTTDELLPTSDYEISKDQYEAIDDLYARKVDLEDALRVAFAYDAGAADELGSILKKSGNRGTPVKNWQVFLEKGGLKGCMEFVPLDMIAGAIDRINVALADKINLLHQVNGIADVMRGAAQQSATATEQSIKAKFGSVRMQAEQQAFARFATELQQLKAEIISKHFDPETIIQHSNVMHTPDAQAAMQAVELLKSQFSRYRIEVRSDQISMTDYAQVKSERLEAIQAIPVLLQALVPMAQALGGPQSSATLLEIVKWGLAGLRGSSGLEGMLDQQISMAQQAAKQPKPPPPPDPKVVAAQMKAQGEQQKIQAEGMKVQAELQADLTRIGAETQAEQAKQQSQAFWDIQAEAMKAKIKAANEPAVPANGPMRGRIPGGS